jgi:hypothetical protein
VSVPGVSGDGPRLEGRGSQDLGLALLVTRAIDLAHAAADGAGDEDITPNEIAAVIQKAIGVPSLGSETEAARRLREALDAVADGMPPDYTATLLQAALKACARG